MPLNGKSTSSNSLPLDNSLSNEPSSAIASKIRWRSQDIDFSNVNAGCNVEFSAPPLEKSPLSYFKEFFSNDVVKMFVDEMNRYSVQKSGGSKSIDTTANEIEQFFGILITSGIVRVPSYRIYWSEGSRYPPIADVMSRNRFDKLRTYLHIANNENMLPRDHFDHDRLFKVRPFITGIQKNLWKIKHEECSAVDELVIPFKGRSILKQYNKNKPHKWGIKVFALTSKSGFFHDFEIYVGKGTVVRSSGLGLSGDIVMRMTTNLPKKTIVGCVYRKN